MADHGKSVFAAAWSLLKNREDAEDVVQETFLRYYTCSRDFETRDHLRAWLLRVAMNRAKDLLRSAARQRTVPLEPELQGEALPQGESGELLRAVLALPERYRGAVHLYYYEDYSLREIAGILGLPQATVKTRLFRARQLLRQALEEDDT